jgi:hypothetical protein
VDRHVVHLREHQIKRLRLGLRHDAQDFLVGFCNGTETARVGQRADSRCGSEGASAKHRF